MTIRLQFVLGRGICSRLIAWWGNGYAGYSHVDAILSDGTLLGARDDRITHRGITYPSGVQVRPQGYEKWARRVIMEIPSDLQETRAWEAWLRRQIGEPYDSDAIMGFILGRKKHSKGHWICSACQTGALEHVGKLKRLPVPPSQVTPNSLMLMATALGGMITRRAA